MSDEQTTDQMSLPRAGILGLIAGALSGIFGVGGGIVLVPGLTIFGKLKQHPAHATSLLAVLFTAPAAAVGFVAEGAVSWAAAGLIATGGFIGAMIGADIMDKIPAKRLRQGFAVLMVVVAVRMAFGGSGSTAENAEAVKITVTTVVLLGLTGIASGLLSAIMGIGGGVVLVPLMVFGFGFGQHLAEGTSLAVIIPTALVGVLRHNKKGYVKWRTGVAVGLAGVVAAVPAGWATQRIDPSSLTVAFAVLVAIAGVRLALASKDGHDEAPGTADATDDVESLSSVDEAE